MIVAESQFRPGTFVDGFRFIGNNAGFLLHLTRLHLELSLTALAIAIVVALPLGLWLGHRHRGLFLALSVSSVGRSLPSLVLIAFGVLVLGIGFWNNTAALTVLAIPSILTNAYFAIDGVDRDIVDAARGMGMSERQILLRVELPLGLPLVVAGIRIAAIFVIATATIASIAGGSDLGDVIVNPASYGLDGVVGASYCVSALTLLAALLLGAVARFASRRPEPGA